MWQTMTLVAMLSASALIAGEPGRYQVTNKTSGYTVVNRVPANNTPAPVVFPLPVTVVQPPVYRAPVVAPVPFVQHPPFATPAGTMPATTVPTAVQPNTPFRGGWEAAGIRTLVPAAGRRGAIRGCSSAG